MGLYFDKNEKAIDICDDVNVDATEDNVEFSGMIYDFDGEFILVEDQEQNIFCVLQSQVELKTKN